MLTIHPSFRSLICDQATAPSAATQGDQVPLTEQWILPIIHGFLNQKSCSFKKCTKLCFEFFIFKSFLLNIREKHEWLFPVSCQNISLVLTLYLNSLVFLTVAPSPTWRRRTSRRIRTRIQTRRRIWSSMLPAPQIWVAFLGGRRWSSMLNLGETVKRRRTRLWATQSAGTVK